MTTPTFSWLYGGVTGTPCADCETPLNPAIKRQVWDKEAKEYRYPAREVCDECAVARRRAEVQAEIETESTSPSGQYWNIWGPTSAA